jgi:hypothetical protein
MANKHKKVWKVVSRKVNYKKQTWPKWTSLTQDIQVRVSKINTGRIQDLSLKVVISMLFLFLFFVSYMYSKIWMLTF